MFRTGAQNVALGNDAQQPLALRSGRFANHQRSDIVPRQDLSHFGQCGLGIDRVNVGSFVTQNVV